MSKRSLEDSREDERPVLRRLARFVIEDKDEPDNDTDSDSDVVVSSCILLDDNNAVDSLTDPTQTHADTEADLHGEAESEMPCLPRVHVQRLTVMQQQARHQLRLTTTAIQVNLQLAVNPVA